MLGDLELAKFDEEYGKTNPANKDYYNFEKSAYPKRAEHGVKED
jgi:hypothetical protein